MGHATVTLDFAQDQAFRNVRSVAETGHDKYHKVTVTFEKNTGIFKARESWGEWPKTKKGQKGKPHRYEVHWFALGPGDFKLLRFDFQRDFDATQPEENLSDVFDIRFQLRNGVNIQTEFSNQDDKGLLWGNPGFGLTQQWVGQAKFLRILIDHPNESLYWDASGILAACRQALAKSSEANYEDFIRFQKEAFDAEGDANERQLEMLGRGNVEAVIARPLKQDLQDRFQVTFFSPEDRAKKRTWNLEPGTRVSLVNESINDGPFLKDDVQKPPMRRGAWNQDLGWSATLQDWGTNVALIENPITPKFRSWLQRGPSSRAVKVNLSVEAEDPLAVKIRAFLDRLQKVFQIEDRNIAPQDRAKILSVNRECVLRTSVPKLLLPKYGQDFGYADPWKTASGDHFNIPDRLEMLPSHRKFMDQILQGVGRFAICQGPPATGKTELVMKIIGLLLTQVDLGGERIVVAAKTNTACREVGKRLAGKLRTFFNLNAEKDVVLFQTSNMALRFRLSMKDRTDAVDNLTLDAHMLRLAKRLRNQEYIKGWNELCRTGQIENGADRLDFDKARASLQTQVRQTARVFIGTLAACTSEFFAVSKDSHGLEKAASFDRKVKCKVLLVDEASQAEFPALWAAWFCLDPARIILTGNHMQLSPYATTEVGKLGFSKSLLEQLIRRRFPYTTLDVQFRTAPNIYFATSQTHYNGVVDSHDSTKNRECYQRIISAVNRIQFKDARGQIFSLCSNSHLFNIINGQRRINSTTKSSENVEEVGFINGFVVALMNAGLSTEEILLLTGYKGQLAKFGNLTSPHPNVVSSSVDSYQGGEANVVVMSLVVDGKGLEGNRLRKHLAFMLQVNRQNVMTSRAKDGAFFVASGEIPTYEPWRSYFKAMASKHENWRMDIKAPVQFSLKN